MDELLGRKMPHSATAEQAVIGSILLDPNCLPEVLGLLRVEDFYIRANREIFETIMVMFSYSQTVDAVTLLNQMRVRGVYEENSQQYILDLMRLTPTAANVMEYAAIVRDRAMLRALAQAASEIGDAVYEGAGEAENILELAEKKIYALRQGRTGSDLMPLSTVLQNLYEQMSEAASSQNSVPGVETGLSGIDQRILGLQKGDLAMIASRPGMGKTSIALNIALHVARTSKKTVAVFSLEMSREQLAMRLLSTQSRIDSKLLQTGRLSEDDWRRINAAASVLSSLDLRINDNPMLTVSDMNAQCRRVKNLGLVVIDYLQLMTSAGGPKKYADESRTTVVSDISRMLKIMAKELEVPVLCLSQLSRANEGRQNKRPMLSDLRESGAIEQDADLVIGLYRDEYYSKEECENPAEAEAIILKNRRGETGTVYLHWDAQTTTYSSMTGRTDG
ncbi:MAG: replicative DNA helicase [Oscillospiraceae bacterium]|nr:replicative DNA helicase [Oscillospiraceae bacterium]